MLIKTAEFFSSSPKSNLCPKPTLPEYAFIGRSNVGKSSLINMLTNHKDLAKTSSTPGKTKLINHFIINDKWYLVDLPGYGYAKTSKTEKSLWIKMIEKYISERENLMLIFVLIDSRIEPQSNDLQFIDWLGINQVPFAIVFTKTDKLGLSQVKSNSQLFKNKLLENWEELPEIFFTSSKNKKGKEEILKYIETSLPYFKQTN